MHFDIPWWLWALLGYLIALVIFNGTARGVFLNTLRGQLNPPSRKKRRK